MPILRTKTDHLTIKIKIGHTICGTEPYYISLIMLVLREDNMIGLPCAWKEGNLGSYHYTVELQKT